MTRLFDDPAMFMDDMLAGFLDAHESRVVGVPGGVVRAAETRPGKVAVVVGGGSGHYPAFCGVVGPGFADGAVVGNVFTSPSTDDAYSVGRAAANGGGLLFSTGNYAGDVMNFTLAQQRLNAEGIATRVVFVTDDVASAAPSEIDKRRGIAGDFVVFKVAGAAAEADYNLDAVEAVARRANDRTRSLGVAFAGCTMPGADSPLFTVPAGRMGVGLGIHGEPGISEDGLPRAADLARLLVDGVLAEAPADAGPRVGVILNGLGATKYEELFVVWRSVAALLAERGFAVIEPEVGELVTSLDMAGCSLTIVFLDDELEALWRAPADTPAFRKGTMLASAAGPRRAARTESQQSRPGVAVQASPASAACARPALDALVAMQVALEASEDDLGRLDAIAGDGDHGRGMVKGIRAAVAAAQTSVAAGEGVGSVLRAAGQGWAGKAGGTSGVLWGAALESIGERLGDASDQIVAEDVADAINAGLDTLQRLGKAQLGDKTMVDAWQPFAAALRTEVAAGQPLSAAWSVAAGVAGKAAAETSSLRPKLGRARPLAERSVGHPDPGAISLVACLQAITSILPETSCSAPEDATS